MTSIFCGDLCSNHQPLKSADDQYISTLKNVKKTQEYVHFSFSVSYIFPSEIDTISITQFLKSNKNNYILASGSTPPPNKSWCAYIWNVPFRDFLQHNSVGTSARSLNLHPLNQISISDNRKTLERKFLSFSVSFFKFLHATSRLCFCLSLSIPSTNFEAVRLMLKTSIKILRQALRQV